jgi:aspartyl-tRNA(Asn)/glutamyl-tRNA(Gln) amidotransferase subunit C
MKLTKAQVRHVAQLARLGLSERQITKFREDLSAILEYVELLDEVDTSEVRPTFQTAGLKNVSREDRVKKEVCLSQNDVLANAPRKEKGFVKTGAVL